MNILWLNVRRTRIAGTFNKCRELRWTLLRQSKPFNDNKLYSKSEKKGEVCMKLYFAGGKFTNKCMVGNGGKTERVCSKKEPCPKKAKYIFGDDKRYVRH